MHFFLSGYYGYQNAGDEAVLAAILQHLSDRFGPETRFTVASGDPSGTVALHGAGRQLQAVPRQRLRALPAAIRVADVFISGGGSLLQDVTSLRNVAYYVGLMRMAALYRKPVIIYAQGVGPLHRPLAQNLARIAMQRATLVTLRDEDSRRLVERLGVRRPVEVTADPVWALPPAPADDASSSMPLWGINLRPPPGQSTPEPGNADTTELDHLTATLCAAARQAGAALRFFPMQPQWDGPLLRRLFERHADPATDAVVDTGPLHPRQLMAEVGRYRLMVSMRLHSLIFAGAQRVPCVAISYDPKVASLAAIMGAPLLRDCSSGEVARLPEALAAAAPIAAARLEEQRQQALRTAELLAAAVGA